MSVTPSLLNEPKSSSAQFKVSVTPLLLIRIMNEDIYLVQGHSIPIDNQLTLIQRHNLKSLEAVLGSCTVNDPTNLAWVGRNIDVQGDTGVREREA